MRDSLAIFVTILGIVVDDPVVGIVGLVRGQEIGATARTSENAPLPERKWVSESEVEEKVLKWLRKQQPADAPLRFTRALAALGWLPKEMDPLPPQARLLAGQLGGWYDRDQNRLLLMDRKLASPPGLVTNDDSLALDFGQVVREFGHSPIADTLRRQTTDMRLARESFLWACAHSNRLTRAAFKSNEAQTREQPQQADNWLVKEPVMPEFLRELGTLPCVLGLNFSQALHQAGKSLPPQNVDAWPLVSAAQIVDPRTCLSASQAAQRTEIRAVNDKLNAAAPFWDDELGQITCLAVLRTQNSTEDAAHATRGLVADRLLAWSGDRDARNHAAWQTMWNGTDAADAFETAITKVIAEQYGVVTRDGEGFAFSAKGRYVSLLRNRNSLGVLFLNTADAQSLADLSKLLND